MSERKVKMARKLFPVLARLEHQRAMQRKAGDQYYVQTWHHIRGVLGLLNGVGQHRQNQRRRRPIPQ